MKEWLILKLAGPIGGVFKSILAAIIGVFVGVLYEKVWVAVYEVTWLKITVEKIIAAISPEVVASLTPQAVGTTVAVLAWAALSQWIIATLKSGNRQIQNTLNATPAAANVTVDGIILKHGETATSVSRLAYEALYPDDTVNRGGDGVPETRKPLP